jgi:hypothetical protein
MLELTHTDILLQDLVTNLSCYYNLNLALVKIFVLAICFWTCMSLRNKVDAVTLALVM